MVFGDAITALGGYSKHERRVARIARHLFDVLAPLHGLGARERRVLHIAALLHDAADGGDHHISGAENVLFDRSLEMSARRRRCIAYLVRYHRGHVPGIGRDEILQPGDRRRKMRVLLALLRAADSLDSRRLPRPTIRIRLRGRELSIRCDCRKKLARARRILSRKAKFDLLERVLGLRVTLRIARAAELASA